MIAWTSRMLPGLDLSGEDLPMRSAAARRRREARGMGFEEIIYSAEDGVAQIVLNRPQYRNAQGYRMLDEIDAAFGLAGADEAVKVVIVRGSGGVFSTGHDLGTPEGMAYRNALGAKP